MIYIDGIEMLLKFVEFINNGYSRWFRIFSFISAYTFIGKGCKLCIGSGNTIGNFYHIIATRKISINKNVLIVDKVCTGDNWNEYHDMPIPLVKQQIGWDIIGEDTWIGGNFILNSVVHSHKSKTHRSSFIKKRLFKNLILGNF